MKRLTKKEDTLENSREFMDKFRKSASFSLSVYDKLQEYENAEEEGLLVRLPIAIGETIYQIMARSNDYTCDFYYIVGTRGFTLGLLSEVGKTIFKTEAEALQAIKERG